MAQIYYDADANLDLLSEKKIAILGYGNQGHAHALNLRDSGCDVVVGLAAESKSRQRAEADGFAVLPSSVAAKQADMIMLLAPDQDHREIFEREIRPVLTSGKMLMTCHGFSLHYSQITPPPNVDVAMVAPKGPGHTLRHLYTKGSGLFALWAVYQDATSHAEALTLAYARAIGCTRTGALRTTMAEETETDLFGEQAVLCGGITELVLAGFETLMEAGYQPEVAYIECMHEVKLVVDLLCRGGMDYMHKAISDTAEYGAYVAGPRLIDRHTRNEMRKILQEIQNGVFASNWMLENRVGRPSFLTMRHRYARHQVEEVGRVVRNIIFSSEE